MGPRLNSRGDSRVGLSKTVAGMASMGPRLNSRGDSRSRCNHVAAGDRLQWGRDLIVAETEQPVAGGLVLPALQWGRDLIVAETAPVQSPGFQRARPGITSGPAARQSFLVVRDPHRPQAMLRAPLPACECLPGFAHHRTARCPQRVTKTG